MYVRLSVSNCRVKELHLKQLGLVTDGELLLIVFGYIVRMEGVG